MVKLGFPKGLFYYEYYPFWEEFFKNLNVDLVLSPKSNKHILDEGIENCVDEACLPVKIFHGHVNYLKNKVDYIFIPRYYSQYKREYNCPKHLGLVNMVFNNIEDLPPILSPKIISNKPANIRKTAYKVGRIFTYNNFIINKAYNRAQLAHRTYMNWLKEEFVPRENKEILVDRIKIMLVGHTYNVYDKFINMNILNKLIEQDIELIFVEDMEESISRKYSEDFKKRIFWTSGRRIIGSVINSIEKKNIDGIIYISAFGCGLDSILVEIIADRCIKDNIPYMLITFDEQTGEAGFKTRIEAFIDMINWRYKNENNLSTLG